MAPDPQSPRDEGMMGSVRRLGRTLLRVLQTRLEILSTEITDAGEVRREAGSIAYRPATHRHRVVLDKWVEFYAGTTVTEPCWTRCGDAGSSASWRP